VPADHGKWGALRALRETVNEAIEPLRRDKTIRSSLEADVIVPQSEIPAGFTEQQLAELFITASCMAGDSEAVQVTKSDNHKCGRCWRLLPEVAEDGDLCGRCEETLAEMDA
jgi:isoleucyl-tRNA synthetase